MHPYMSQIPGEDEYFSRIDQFYICQTSQTKLCSI